MSNEQNTNGQNGNQRLPLWEKVMRMILDAPWAAVLSIIVVVGAMLFVASVITGPQQHGDIRDTEYARGFITVLFGVGTIGIALLVTLSAIFITDQNAKERFDRGKEVLSLLLGIFGTIIGFYYGTAPQKPVGGQGTSQSNIAAPVPAPGAANPAAKMDAPGKVDEPAKAPSQKAPSQKAPEAPGK